MCLLSLMQAMVWGKKLNCISRPEEPSEANQTKKWKISPEQRVLVWQKPARCLQGEGLNVRMIRVNLKSRAGGVA